MRILNFALQLPIQQSSTTTAECSTSFAIVQFTEAHSATSAQNNNDVQISGVDGRRTINQLDLNCLLNEDRIISTLSQTIEENNDNINILLNDALGAANVSSNAQSYYIYDLEAVLDDLTPSFQRTDISAIGAAI